MLRLTIKDQELWDERSNSFLNLKGQTIQLEHSLVSLQKWESKWHKPFLSTKKTFEETIDYIRCMTVTQNVDSNLYLGLTSSDIIQVNDYIDNPMTATVITDYSEKPKKDKEIITAELIYYWMIAFNIPTEYRKWHLNQLITLIDVCERKQRPPKKIPMNDILARNKRINEENKKRFNTRG